MIPTQTNAIRFYKTGGPEVLKWENVKLPAPTAGEVTLRNKACGLNFIDTYHRSGLYAVPLPSGLGLEGAGIVEAIGPGVTTLKIGDRVAYCAAPLGAYSEWRNYPADKLIKLPDDIDFNTAAAMMLQGMTVEYLIRRTYPVKAGDFVLFHAAAGGVGSIAVQWLKALGAVVIVESESFHPGFADPGMIDPAQALSLRALLPDLTEDPLCYGDPGRRLLTAPETAILRHDLAA